MATAITTSWTLAKQIYVGNDGNHDVYWRMYARISAQDASQTTVAVEGRLYLTGSYGSYYSGPTTTAGGVVGTYTSWGNNVAGTYYPGESTLWTGSDTIANSAGQVNAGVRFYSSPWGWTSDSLYISDTLTFASVPAKPTVSASPSTPTKNNISYGVSSFGTAGSGTVYLYSDVTPAPTTVINTKTTTGTTVFEHTGIMANALYYYRALAYSSVGWSEWSNETSQLTKPAAATVSVSSYNETEVSVYYYVAANGGSATQTLEYSINGGSWTTAQTITGGQAKEGTFTITGLASNTAYSIATRMTNYAGSTQGTTLSVHTALAPAQGYVSVSNNDNTTNTITYGVSSFGYPTTGVVYLHGATTSVDNYVIIATKETTGNSTFTHNNLTPNTRYYYKCAAGNYVMNGPSSGDLTIVTKPANIQASVSSYSTNTITIHYSIEADGGVYSKELQYSTAGLASGYTTVATISSGNATSGSFTITGLAPGTDYPIYIRLHTTAGNTYISGSVIYQKTAQAPSGLTVAITSKTWDTVTLSGSISSYGYPSNVSGRHITLGVNPYPLPDPLLLREEVVAVDATSGSGTVTNNSGSGGGSPFTLCGCVGVYPYIWVDNTVAYNFLRDTLQVYYLPPAPLATLALSGLTTGSSDVTAVVNVAGQPADGSKNVSGALVNTEYRYLVGEGSYSAWTQIGSNEAPNTLHQVTLTGLPFETTITIQARQVFSGEYSEVKTLSFTTDPKPVGMYGSISGEAKPVVKAYGSVGGTAKTIIKGYGSVGGVAKRIY